MVLVLVAGNQRPHPVDAGVIRREATPAGVHAASLPGSSTVASSRASPANAEAPLTTSVISADTAVQPSTAGNRHPKYLWRLVDKLEAKKLHRKEAYPDVLAHWRRCPVNVLVVEVKKSTNTDAAGREIDDFKLSSFTAAELPDNETFRCHVGLFLDIATGHHIGDKLSAKAKWYLDGGIREDDNELCPTPYDGP